MHLSTQSNDLGTLRHCVESGDTNNFVLLFPDTFAETNMNQVTVFYFKAWVPCLHTAQGGFTPSQQPKAYWPNLRQTLGKCCSSHIHCHAASLVWTPILMHSRKMAQDKICKQVACLAMSKYYPHHPLDELQSAFLFIKNPQFRSFQTLRTCLSHVYKGLLTLCTKVITKCHHFSNIPSPWLLLPAAVSKLWAANLEIKQG